MCVVILKNYSKFPRTKKLFTSGPYTCIGEGRAYQITSKFGQPNVAGVRSRQHSQWGDHAHWNNFEGLFRFYCGFEM